MWNPPTLRQLSVIPGLYVTEHVPLADKIIYMHFFCGACDWYVNEFDGTDLFFGLANLGDDQCAEWGYVSLQELKDLNIRGLEIDRDLQWKTGTARELENIPRHCLCL